MSFIITTCLWKEIWQMWNCDKMKDAGDRHHKQKLESDDGLKTKIRRVTPGIILNKEKRKGKGGGGEIIGDCVYYMGCYYVRVQNVQCVC